MSCIARMSNVLQYYLLHFVLKHLSELAIIAIADVQQRALRIDTAAHAPEIARAQLQQGGD